MIQTITPISPLLKTHIECIYLYSGDENSSVRYLAFPHINTCLSVFKGVTIKRQASYLKIVASETNEICLELIGKYTNPILIEYEGKCQEISIIFKPLGALYFISDSFESLNQKFSNPINNKKWTDFMGDFFLEEFDIVKFESFLLSQFIETKQFDKLHKSLSLLNSIDDKASIASIAFKLEYHPKTFHRHFTKYVGCTPIEYKRICRFRNSIALKLHALELKTLTNITYENGFFDQAHFNREFKKLTNHNPNDFFSVVNKVDGNTVVWKLL